MKCAGVFPMAAFMLIAAMAAPAAAAGEAGNEIPEGCAGGCSTAVGIVNVTLVEPPPVLAGFFIAQPFDFGELFSALSAALSAAAPFLGF